jgi:hypothetical protein
MSKEEQNDKEHNYDEDREELEEEQEEETGEIKQDLVFVNCVLCSNQV